MDPHSRSWALNSDVRKLHIWLNVLLHCKIKQNKSQLLLLLLLFQTFRIDFYISELFGWYRYKERFLQGLPENRKPHTDFTKPVFTAVAFYLSAEYKKVFSLFFCCCVSFLQNKWMSFLTVLTCYCNVNRVGEN